MIFPCVVLSPSKCSTVAQLLDCKSLKLSLVKIRLFQSQDGRTAWWLLQERFKLGDVNQGGKYKARCRANVRRKVDLMHHQPVCHLMTACSSLHLIHDPGLYYRNKRIKKHESFEIGVFFFFFFFFSIIDRAGWLQVSGADPHMVRIGTGPPFDR